MRLLSLHVENFGVLHDRDMTFAPGLNVILEENGQGKSTLAGFVKAMLYGLPAVRRTDLPENERRRFTPWQGGPFGGSMTFEANGKTYRAERFFSEKEKNDTFRLYDAETNLPSEDFSARLGEELYGIDAAAYERTAYLPQQAVTGGEKDRERDRENLSIHAKLNGLIDAAGDINAYENAMTALDKQRQALQRHGGKGLIPELEETASGLRASLSECRAAKRELEDLGAKLAFAETALREQEETVKALREASVRRAEASTRRAVLSGGRALFERREKAARETEEKKRLLGALADDRRAAEFLLSGAETELTAAKEAKAKAEALGEELTALRARLADAKQAEIPAWYEEHPVSEEDETRLAELLQRSVFAGREAERNRALLGCADPIPGEELDAVYAKWKSLGETGRMLQAAEERRAEAVRKHAVRSRRGLAMAVIGGLLVLFGAAGAAVVLAAGKRIGISSDMIYGCAVIEAVGLVLLCMGIFIRRSIRRAEFEAESLIAGLRGAYVEDKAAIPEFLGTYAPGMMKSNVSRGDRPGSSEEDAFGVLYAVRRAEEAQAETAEALGIMLAALPAVEENGKEIISGAAEDAAEQEKRAEALLRSLQIYRKRAEEKTDAQTRAEAGEDSLTETRERAERDAAEAEIRAGKLLASFPAAKGLPYDAAAARIRELLIGLDADRADLADAKRAWDAFSGEHGIDEAQVSAVPDAIPEEEPPEEERLQEAAERLEALREERGRLLLLSERLSAEVREEGALTERLASAVERKTAAEHRLQVLLKTANYLEEAKKTLSTRYLYVMQRRFRAYYALLAACEKDDAERLSLDAGFGYRMEVGGERREAGSLSRGYRDLVNFCLRLALADTLYDRGELPLLILDDPFVNLDKDKLHTAMTLLGDLAQRYQVLYFTCHESRVPQERL